MSHFRILRCKTVQGTKFQNEFLNEYISIFQGDSVGVTTAAQGYITISGVVGAPAARVFSGIALSSPVTTAAKQQAVPGALFVTGK